MCSRRKRDEELRSVRVWAGVGHREDSCNINRIAILNLAIRVRGLRKPVNMTADVLTGRGRNRHAKVGSEKEREGEWNSEDGCSYGSDAQTQPKPVHGYCSGTLHVLSDRRRTVCM